jgi:hypothetical protein
MNFITLSEQYANITDLIHLAAIDVCDGANLKNKFMGVMVYF